MTTEIDPNCIFLCTKMCPGDCKEHFFNKWTSLTHKYALIHITLYVQFSSTILLNRYPRTFYHHSHFFIRTCDRQWCVSRFFFGFFFCFFIFFWLFFVFFYIFLVIFCFYFFLVIFCFHLFLVSFCFVFMGVMFCFF